MMTETKTFYVDADFTFSFEAFERNLSNSRDISNLRNAVEKQHTTTTERTKKENSVFLSSLIENPDDYDIQFDIFNFFSSHHESFIDGWDFCFSFDSNFAANFTFEDCGIVIDDLSVAVIPYCRHSYHLNFSSEISLSYRLTNKVIFDACHDVHVERLALNENTNQKSIVYAPFENTVVFVEKFNKGLQCVSYMKNKKQFFVGDLTGVELKEKLEAAVLLGATGTLKVNKTTIKFENGLIDFDEDKYCDENGNATYEAHQIISVIAEIYEAADETTSTTTRPDTTSEPKNNQISTNDRAAIINTIETNKKLACQNVQHLMYDSEGSEYEEPTVAERFRCTMTEKMEEIKWGDPSVKTETVDASAWNQVKIEEDLLQSAGEALDFMQGSVDKTEFQIQSPSDIMRGMSSFEDDVDGPLESDDDDYDDDVDGPFESDDDDYDDDDCEEEAISFTGAMLSPGIEAEADVTITWGAAKPATKTEADTIVEEADDDAAAAKLSRLLSEL